MFHSIMIFSHRWEIRHEFDKIMKLLDENPMHETEYSTFKFTRIEFDDEKIIYSVQVERNIPFKEKMKFYHNICFTKNGFLIIGGNMLYKQTLLKCLKEILYPDIKYNVFKPKYIGKRETDNFVGSLLSDTNRIYNPRFCSISSSLQKEFNGFKTSKTKCATSNKEYNEMKKHASYFNPIFKINKIDGIDFPHETEMRMQSNYGYFYSSHPLAFKEWLSVCRYNIYSMGA